MRKSELRDLYEVQPVSHPILAYIGDTHVGGAKGMSAEAFAKQCEKVAKDKKINIAILAGDIVDRNADREVVASVEDSIGLVRREGKKVIIVWGNNEDRIQRRDPEFRNRLSTNGAIVLQDEDRATVVETIDNKTGKKLKTAFVAASRIVTIDEQKKVMSSLDKREQVLTNRRFLSQGNPSRLDKFKQCLASTVKKSKDENGFPNVETLPTVVLFHAPENLSWYPEYRRYAKDREIADSEYFTQAIAEHQKKYRNIIFGLFGHVEGGSKIYDVNIPECPPMKYFNACSNVINGSFAIAA